MTGGSSSVKLMEEIDKLDQRKDLDLSQKCELKIEGMTCGSCVEVCYVFVLLLSLVIIPAY